MVSQWAGRRSGRRPRRGRRRRDLRQTTDLRPPSATAEIAALSRARRRNDGAGCRGGSHVHFGSFVTRSPRAYLLDSPLEMTAASTAQPPCRHRAGPRPTLPSRSADGGALPSRRRARRRRRARVLHELLPELSPRPFVRSNNLPRPQRRRWAQGHRGERGRHLAKVEDLTKKLGVRLRGRVRQVTVPLRRSWGSSRCRPSS